MGERVVLSEARNNTINVGKKRGYHPEDYSDFMAKKNKAEGNPYRRRAGPFKPGILAPKEVRSIEYLVDRNIKFRDMDKWCTYLYIYIHDILYSIW